MNRLANERSPYLRHAAHQRIDWHPWGDEAFERARLEDKPVFLSSGGVWCHWCHVMARESFENDEIAALLNELFISVKLDRDERPEIDRRYQQAVALMGSAGGWPLSVFLTPDRRPFFGGAYFPPRDGFGRPGFPKVLRSVAEFYRTKRGDADQYGVRVMEALRQDASPRGTAGPDLIARLQASMLALHDPVHGGFGGAPKFPQFGAIEFLLRRAAGGDRAAEAAARRTLDAMAAGGFHDQLGGGFHRYSVDEGWFVPHFEKMADDNAWLLRNYLDAYALFGEERYRCVAGGVIRFFREALSDPAGGFFASQDADVTPGDEGGYFTWTERDLHGVLTIEEFTVLERHLLHERGRLPHDPEKRVLCIAETPAAVAAALGKDADAVARIIAAGKEKLLAARGKREEPFVDRTLYTSLNGMCITSFLRAFRAFGDAELRSFALRSLDRLLQDRFRNGALERTEGVRGLLDDHIHLIEALVAAYEATGERGRLEQAAALMDACLAAFGDPGGGFFDTQDEVLGLRLKRIEDIPHPSANAVAVQQLIKLGHITGQERYQEAAERALAAFASSVEGMSVHAGAYASGLDARENILQLRVEAPAESSLGRAALGILGPATVVVHGADQGRVLPCSHGTCHEPAARPDDLERFSGRRRGR